MELDGINIHANRGYHAFSGAGAGMRYDRTAPSTVSPMLRPGMA